MEGHYDIIIAQVDPDAIGASVALKAYIESFEGADASIYYCGSISHRQNRHIVNKYNLPSIMFPLTDEVELGEKIALVDSSDQDDLRFPRSIPLPVIVVDHHRGDIKEAEELYMVEEVGSASTLMCELLEPVHFEGYPYLGALLALGIYTDTKALMATSQRDRDAYGKMLKIADIQEIAHIINYPLPTSHYSNLTYALNHMTKDNNGRCLASVGFLEADQSDDISTIADYLIRMDSVSLVVVWGIVGDHVRISARNRDLSTPLDQFLKSRFGEGSGAKLAPDGRGEGGARIGLDLGFWYADDNKSEIKAMVSKRLGDLIFS